MERSLTVLCKYKGRREVAISDAFMAGVLLLAKLPRILFLVGGKPRSWDDSGIAYRL